MDCFSGFGGLQKYIPTQAVQAAVGTLSRSNLRFVLFPRESCSN